MRASLLAGVASVALCLPALAQQEFPATLASHAVLAAESFLPAPADAPATSNDRRHHRPRHRRDNARARPQGCPEGKRARLLPRCQFKRS